MKFRCYIFLCLLPVLGAGQDSIRREAVQITNKQVDSVRSNTRYYWYRSPKIMDNGLKGLLVSNNEQILRMENKLLSAISKSDSLQRANASVSNNHFTTVIKLNKETAKNQKLLLEKQTFNNSLQMLYWVLIIAWLVLKGIGIFKRYKMEKADGATNYS